MSTLHERLALTPDQLGRALDPASLPFETTADVAALSAVIGQPRAIDAIEFGLAVNAQGYNLFVAGAPGSGRESTIRTYLERFAPTRSTPSDWVYVYNFDDPDRPNAIPLPAGRGSQFARAMDQFVQAAQREISRAFESEDYAKRQQDLLNELSRKRDQLYTELQAYAHELGFALQQTQVGIASIPLVNGKPVSVEDFEKLPTEQREAYEQRGEELQGRIGASLRQAHLLERDLGERSRQLERDVALYVVGPLFEDLREAYADQPEILAYLDSVQKDLPDNLAEFRPTRSESDAANPMAQALAASREDSLARYQVNVFIDHSATQGAPVVIEGNPTYYNLVGRVDYRSTFGALVTSFQHIKPGALHRANGGFLVLRAVDLLRTPFAWDALKRALLSRQIQIENLGEQYTSLPMETLRPEPIPFDLKIILIGPLSLYHMLYQYDEDFQELFKVKADFAPDMDWTQDQVMHYAAFIRRRVEENGLKHFDRSAVARVVEYSARQREDKRKLSTRMLDIADLVTEANFWADRAGHAVVCAEDVDQAIDKQEYHSNLVAERVMELIADHTIMIDTTGGRVGQVNGIAIADLGDYAFGKPARISARVSIGQGAIQSIERETQMSGPIHTKGFLTLSGYLAGQYGQDIPLSLGATITFEQAYDEIEGDSASSAELYALLSALSGYPVHQGIAVTGSVNQFGEVQAVGGVTYKIEGFFGVCQALGLTGEQGVIIPAANIPNLMLKAEVVDAVRAGRFHIWAVGTIEEGIEILTDHPAGERGYDGKFPEGSVHRLVEDRLRHFAEQARRTDLGLRPAAHRRRMLRG